MVDGTERGFGIDIECGRALSDIASHLGFSDLSSFSQTFKRWFGVAPRHYRNGGFD